MMPMLIWYRYVIEILNVRKGMWEHVFSRSHKPEKIFPFGPNADEVMVYGSVSYGLKNGKSNEITWAARAHLVKERAGLEDGLISSISGRPPLVIRELLSWELQC